MHPTLCWLAAAAVAVASAQDTPDPTTTLKPAWRTFDGPVMGREIVVWAGATVIIIMVLIVACCVHGKRSRDYMSLAER